jgi:hypothetical protein
VSLFPTLKLIEQNTRVANHTVPHLSPDEIGILEAINYGWCSAAMGHYPRETCSAVSRAFKEFHKNPPADRDAYLKGVVAIFHEHGVNPCIGKRIAFVGCAFDHGHRISNYVDRFRALFDADQIVEISPLVNGARLSTSNALQLTGGKPVDILLSGNVVNAPDCHAEDFLKASRAALSPKGRAIHVVSYDGYDYLPATDEHALTRIGFINRGECGNSRTPFIIFSDCDPKWQSPPSPPPPPTSGIVPRHAARLHPPGRHIDLPN